MNALQQSLDHLLEVRDQAQKELDAAKAKIETLDDAVDKLKNLILTIDPAYLHRRQDFSGLGITEATKRWLREVGEARTEDIAEELLSRGVKTKSKRLVPTVYATLRNSHDFERRGNKWALKDTSEASAESSHRIAALE